MKKCDRCGHLNDDTQLFCGQCGNKLNEVQSYNVPQQNQPQYNQNVNYTQQQPPQQQFANTYQKMPNSNSKPKKKGKGCLIAVLVVVAIFIMFALIGSLFSSEEETTSTDNPSQATSESTKEDVTEGTTQSKADFINTCQEYTYKEIARNPDNYKGKPAKFKGEVIQVQESGKKVVLRVNVTAEENEFAEGGYLYEDTVYVEYTIKSDNESRILEDDIINMYGTLNGIKTYKSILGEEINVPYLIAEYIDIESE